ncbi:MAG: ATP-binding protein [Rhodobacteraceae bacterium]|jgi:serine/threonine-protein kinase RsbW|nr:ATP-binding protein [Paracoccaceae bacterium]
MGTPSTRPAEALPGFTLPVLARNRSIRDALGEVRERLARMSLLEEEITTIEVVLAEVMNNVAEHAYAWRRDGQMILGLRQTRDGILISVTDEGLPMPDEELPFGERLDPSLPIGDMPEGGFGWLIIRQLARDVAYVREGGVNQLSLRIAVRGSG